jgi:serine-type D-Ala-D-Ala carboxypeptidase (penicillin-binding protein 5/6)
MKDFLKKNIKIINISLLIILLIFTVLNITVKYQITKNLILPAIPVIVSKYPMINKRFTPDITAESAIIVDDTSKVIVFEKNPQLRFSMASTTKIMTALTALDYYRDFDIITVKNTDIEGVVIGLSIGEKLTFKDLLYALLLPSANDAAFALADNYPGGRVAFVKKMNEKASLLKLNYTHFSDPAGLDDDGNYTIVTDLVRLTSNALNNQKFALVVATKHKTITTDHNIYLLNNLNKLLGEDGVFGVKTGFTQGAGEVLVTSKNEQGHTFILIVMKSTDRFADTKKLLDLISDNISYINPLDKLIYKSIFSL